MPPTSVISSFRHIAKRSNPSSDRFTGGISAFLTWGFLWAFIVSLLIVNQPVWAASTIRPGQVLQITVAGHSEFSGMFTVNSDGTVDHPLLAGVPITDLTSNDVKSLLLPGVMRFEREPEVYVVISSVQRIRAEVYGMVKAPGKFEAAAPLNLQQLLAMSGDFVLGADFAHLRIMRSSRGGQGELVVDLTRHFSSDSILITPLIEDGDVVIVPRLAPNSSVRVFGAVQMPGEVVLGSGDTIYDAIQRAGGGTVSADLNRVVLFSGRAGNYSRQTVDVEKSILNGRNAELPRPSYGDIVVVPSRAAWRDATFWITWIQQLAVLTSAIIILSHI